MTQPRAPRSLPCLSAVSMAAALLLLTLLLQACGKQADNADFGLQLRKPAGWTYVSGGQSAVEGDEVHYSAGDVRKAIAAQASAPLFALLKRAPPQKGMNPTFGINLDRNARSRGQTPLALLEVRVKRASDKGHFTVAEAAHETRIAGLPAAQAELRAQQEGVQGQTRVRLNLLLIGEVTVLMAATDTVSGSDDASAEFAQVLASLRFPGAPAAP